MSGESQNNQILFVGQSFQSFEDFKVSLKHYENVHRQKFTIRSSRSISSAHVGYKIKSALVYYEVEYACVHRRGFTSKGSGIRRTSTLRGCCSAVIKLRSTKCGQKLIIRELKQEHIGHELSKTVVDHLPHNRKLNHEQLEEIQTYIQMKADKKQIQTMLLSQGSAKPILKDLRNVAYDLKKNIDNEVQSIVQLLKNTYNCNISVLCSEDKTFKGLYFSTSTMRSNVEAWPEFIAIDGTYKLINNGCTVFLLLVEDSDGHSEIVGICFAAYEDKETLAFFLNCFKEENINACDRIKCFMGDKDMVERDLIKEIFPGVPTYLCLFHSLNTFKREVTPDKMNISKKERDVCLDYLQKLIYSSSDVEYDKILQQFTNVAPKPVWNYFEKNWSGIKEEWAIHSMRHNFLNNTNNRMESINNKLKQVVGKNNTMTEFVKNLFVFLHSQQYERDHHAANHILKRPISRFEKNSFENKYEVFLTKYAFQYVLGQIKLMEFVSIIFNEEDIYYVQSSGNTIRVTTSSCQCRHFQSMLLPCKHIFSIRKKLNLPLFDESLCNIRWTRDYYLQKHRIFLSECADKPLDNTPIVNIETAKNKVVTVSQKRKQLLTITNSLANIGSLACNSVFQYRYKLLKEIESAWRQGQELTIERVELQPQSSRGNESISNTTKNNTLLYEINNRDTEPGPSPDLDVNLSNLATDELILS